MILSVLTFLRSAYRTVHIRVPFTLHTLWRAHAHRGNSRVPLGLDRRLGRLSGHLIKSLSLFVGPIGSTSAATPSERLEYSVAVRTCVYGVPSAIWSNAS